MSQLTSPSIDAKTRRISTYAKGGHAGAIYDASSYRWIRGKLVMVSRASQDWVAAKKHYLRIEGKLVRGKWKASRSVRQNPD